MPFFGTACLISTMELSRNSYVELVYAFIVLFARASFYILCLSQYFINIWSKSLLIRLWKHGRWADEDEAQRELTYQFYAYNSFKNILSHFLCFNNEFYTNHTRFPATQPTFFTAKTFTALLQDFSLIAIRVKL